MREVKMTNQKSSLAKDEILCGYRTSNTRSVTSLVQIFFFGYPIKVTARRVRTLETEAIQQSFLLSAFHTYTVFSIPASSLISPLPFAIEFPFAGS